MRVTDGIWRRKLLLALIFELSSGREFIRCPTEVGPREGVLAALRGRWRGRIGKICITRSGVVPHFAVHLVRHAAARIAERPGPVRRMAVMVERRALVLGHRSPFRQWFGNRGHRGRCFTLLPHSYVDPPHCPGIPRGQRAPRPAKEALSRADT